MTHANRRAGWIVVGAVALASMGCHQATKAPSVSHANPSADPTSWADKDVAKADADSSQNKASLPKSDRLSGSWSSEGRDIENSLGVGR